MTAVLITGMSGTGKSSVLKVLAVRGHRTVDTDYDGWCMPSADGSELIWDEHRMSALLASDEPGQLFVSGAVSNQGLFRDRFESVVLLSAPASVILERVANRATNPYGSTPEDRALILEHLSLVEPLLRATCDIELDATRPIEWLADAIEALT